MESRSLTDSTSSKPGAAPEGQKAAGEESGLSNVEVEVIDLFVNAVRLLGVPKSVGEIYGLLFVSPDPLPLDRLVERLRISKGSASQGLRFLRNLGAVNVVYVAGSRRDHYSAETELKHLASGFIKEEFKPHLESGDLRLGRLKELVRESEGTPEGAFYTDRLGKLASWHSKTRKLLPLVQKFLG